jgi:FKBP-type peptidyl-prolyl cis-trans isomerase SlyD
VEEALHQKEVGFSCTVSMEPENSFGEYDGSLIHIEPRSAFPDNVSVGMRFEGAPEDSEEFIVYTVTDIEDDKVVVDGNHPLAGMKLNFSCTVIDVRPATTEEIAHQHAHDPSGHAH